MQEIQKDCEMKVKVAQRKAKGEIQDIKEKTKEEICNNEMQVEYLHTVCANYV